MALSRYEHPDDYTSAELKLIYEHARPTARIALLRQFGKRGSLPEVLIQLALDDRDPRVRHALVLADVGWGHEAIQKLRNDPEMAVRAAACENRAFLSSAALMRDHIKLFADLNHTERLAMMRNAMIDSILAEKILDQSDMDLGLSELERAQLTYAYLSNADKFDPRHLDAKSYEKAGIPNYDAYEMVRKNEKHFERMWRMAAQWDWWDLKSALYGTIPASDDLKLEAYVQNENEWVRRAIIRACKEGDVKTLTAASKDSDERIAGFAREKLPPAYEKKRNWPSYVWTATVGIVEFLVSLGVLNAAVTRFERLALSLLVMTYVTVRLSASGLGIAIWEQAAIAFSRYLHMLKIMRDPDYDTTREYIEQDVHDANENLTKGVAIAQVRSVALDIVGIAAVITLIRALFA